MIKGFNRLLLRNELRTKEKRIVWREKVRKEKKRNKKKRKEKNGKERRKTNSWKDISNEINWCIFIRFSNDSTIGSDC